MGLVLNTTYQNVFYDVVLTGLKYILRAYNYYVPIYISPERELEKGGTDSYSIRLWGTEAETEIFTAQEWQKRYHVDIVLYWIEPNANENFFRQV